MIPDVQKNSNVYSISFQTNQKPSSKTLKMSTCHPKKPKISASLSLGKIRRIPKKEQTLPFLLGHMKTRHARPRHRSGCSSSKGIVSSSFSIASCEWDLVFFIFHQQVKRSINPFSRTFFPIQLTGLAYSARRWLCLCSSFCGGCRDGCDSENTTVRKWGITG